VQSFTYSCTVSPFRIRARAFWVASYPGLLTPVFVACSTNMGEGLVKLSDIPGHVEEWHIPRKAASKWVCYRSPTRTVTECSTSDSLGDVSWIQKAALQLCRIHHMSRYVMWLSFTRPSPALVLQATNAGVRRPGYETRGVRRPGYEARGVRRPEGGSLFEVSLLRWAYSWGGCICG